MSSQTIISFRPEQVIRRLPWQIDSKAALGFILILATFSLVGWLYLTQASAVTTTSYRIDALRLELDQLKNQNAALALEIAQLEAMPHIEGRARELNFGPTNNVRYLPVSNYPAAMDETAQSSLASPQPGQVQVAPTPWWVESLDRFAAWLEGK
ncbi:MAG: hypothetical protein AB1801_05910 [Chloroflexota bacterium]